jgi:hypothetical protein
MFYGFIYIYLFIYIYKTPDDFYPIFPPFFFPFCLAPTLVALFQNHYVVPSLPCVHICLLSSIKEDISEASLCLCVPFMYISQPRWSWIDVLASKSKVCWWIFQDVKILSISPPGGTLSYGSRV